MKSLSLLRFQCWDRHRGSWHQRCLCKLHSSLKSDVIFKKNELGGVWGDAVFHGQDLLRGLSWPEMLDVVTLQCFCEDPQACSPYTAEFLTDSCCPGSWGCLSLCQTPSDLLHFAFRGLDGDKSLTLPLMCTVQCIQHENEGRVFSEDPCLLP